MLLTALLLLVVIIVIIGVYIIKSKNTVVSKSAPTFTQEGEMNAFRRWGESKYITVDSNNIFNPTVDTLAHGIVPLNPNISIVSCSQSRIPPLSFYPNGYKTFSGVTLIMGAELDGTNASTRLPSSGDVVLWIAGLVPNKQYTLTLMGIQYSYTSDNDGRVVLAQKPLPIPVSANVLFGQSSLETGRRGPTGEVFGSTITPFPASITVNTRCQKSCADSTPGMEKLKACELSITQENDPKIIMCTNCDDDTNTNTPWVVYGELDNAARVNLMNTLMNTEVELLDNKKSKINLSQLPFSSAATPSFTENTVQNNIEMPPMTGSYNGQPCYSPQQINTMSTEQRMNAVPVCLSTDEEDTTVVFAQPFYYPQSLMNRRFWARRFGRRPRRRRPRPKRRGPATQRNGGRVGGGRRAGGAGGRGI